MIGIYDYIVIGFYFAFMLLIGVIFRKFNHNTSDYFRGGGCMLWWLSGASSFMVMFSAWMFTGAAGKTYDTGTLILIMSVGNVVGSIFVYFFTCYRFRQMRVITYVEAVRRRFGRFNQQLYVWMQVFFGLLGGALALNAIGVFIASVFGISLELTIIIIGAAVVFMSVTGGAWAVVASNFVQMLMVMSVTIVAAFLALRLPEVGGIMGLIDKAPPAHFDWTLISRGPVIAVWVIAMVIGQFLSLNAINTGASRFLTVKDGIHARKAALITIFGLSFGAIIWMIPPMAATIACGNLAEQFPLLRQPNEAAYVAICLKTMPQGLIGLLVCGIFAATISSMDSALNMNSGVFIRDFYLRILRPKAAEIELLFMGKLFTLIFGAIVILGGLYVSKVRTMGLFELTLVLGLLIGHPMVIPMFLGIFIKRTPAWSAWSTVLVGLVTAWVTKFYFDLSFFERLAGFSEPLSITEAADVSWAVAVIVVSVSGTVWYCFTSLFYKYSTAEYKQQVEEFFADVNTPIDHKKEDVKSNDLVQYRVLGLLCLIYGFATILFMFIPNGFSGRMCFGFCAAVPLVTGFILRQKAKNIENSADVNCDKTQVVLMDSNEVEISLTEA